MRNSRDDGRGKEEIGDVRNLKTRNERWWGG